MRMILDPYGNLCIVYSLTEKDEAIQHAEAAIQTYQESGTDTTEVENVLRAYEQFSRTIN